ncbi:hypothetical protein D7S81_28515 [Ralstonia insidiosa]|nr:hypothetical protein [Ralstonia insidiosa]MBA9940536.1 hypothetical protein [Ralstonia insidiosa]
MTSAEMTTRGVECPGQRSANIDGPPPPDRKPYRLASLAWLAVSLAIGVGIALWVFHKVQFEQQADGVMTAQFAERLGLIGNEDGRLGRIEQVWFARSAAGGYLYRAVYQSAGKGSGVIRRTTRIDLIRSCNEAQEGGCRMLKNE